MSVDLMIFIFLNAQQQRITILNYTYTRQRMYIISSYFILFSKNRKFMKKGKGIELGPLNLSKTQYKSYVGGTGIKPRFHPQFPFESGSNILIDIPPPQETHQVLPDHPRNKLRQKIQLTLCSLNGTLSDQWRHYSSKVQIIDGNSYEWNELQTYLLTIIDNLLGAQKKLLLKLESLQKIDKSYEGQNSQFSEIKYSKNRLCQKLNKVNHAQSCQYDKTQSNNINRTFYNSQTEETLLNGLKDQMHETYISHNKQNTIEVQSKHKKEKQLLKIQIVRLEKKLDMMNQEMVEKQLRYKAALQKASENCNHDFQQKYFLLMEEKMKYENDLESKKMHNNILTKEFIVLKEKYRELEATNAHVLEDAQQKIKQNKKLEGFSRYRQLWLMSHQQILSLKDQIDKLKSEKDNEVKKNMGFKQKLKELSKNFNYNYNVSLENQRDKQNLNKVLKDFRDWLKFIAVPRISKGMMNRNTYFPDMKIQEHDSTVNQYIPNDDGTNYKLLRPNFFIYFEAYENIIIAEKKFPQRKTMPPDFFLMIRAIFDAMYLHFTFDTTFMEWKNFPEFTISFFEKFEIHPESRNAVVRKNACQGQQKINFLLNVFNLQAANTWECDLFRSFLLEDYTLDQIYFYLDCRNSLLKGPQLNSNFGSADAITLIKFQRAEQVIKQKLESYDSEMVERVSKFLIAKKKVKHQKELIDMNFVLNILLEVYSIEKIKSERFFYQTFKSGQQNSKITYTEYSSFMYKNFPFLTKGDIAKLYREIYALGLGRVTYKTIHFICLMRGLFIPLLQQKLLKNKAKTHKLSQHSNILEDTLFLNMQNEANKISVGLEEFGNEQIIGIDLTINKFLNQIPHLQRSKELFEINLFKLLIQITKIKSIASWRSRRLNQDNKISHDQVREKISQLLAYTYQCIEDIDSIKKNRQQRKNAMKKLTRNFKIRIQESFLQFSLGEGNKLDQKVLQLENGYNKSIKQLELTEKQIENGQS